jgi:hypothetical protein
MKPLLAFPKSNPRHGKQHPNSFAVSFMVYRSLLEKVGRRMGAKSGLSEHKSEDAGEYRQPNQREFCGFLERAMGIEPTSALVFL